MRYRIYFDIPDKDNPGKRVKALVATVRGDDAKAWFLAGIPPYIKNSPELRIRVVKASKV